MGGGVLDPEVAPGGFNPNYAIGTKAGVNSVGLAVANLPSHTHIATTNITEPNSGQGHRHDFEATNNLDGGPRPNGFVNANSGGVSTYQTAYATTGITVNVTNASTGSDTPHQNNQPAIACYYIMYIP
jgi:microcystin-dependent protein